ncbi:hypothetical protein EYF80_005455 [Liparis tanakae]|uniref:Uncharacterized protein n=1 Tax=Liparis tanakae TaxID=230148 RepID=A0A4Z2J346_9TELE|nr:hypothetical protein EYF80_005455 [Liparis tanakae]
MEGPCGSCEELSDRRVGVKFIIDAADDADWSGTRGQGLKGAVTVKADNAGWPTRIYNTADRQLLHHSEHQLILSIQLHGLLQGHSRSKDIPIQTSFHQGRSHLAHLHRTSEQRGCVWISPFHSLVAHSYRRHSGAGSFFIASSVLAGVSLL